MSGRATKWIIIVVLPVLLALYASYPPTGVVVEKVHIEKRAAETAADAKAHDVALGQYYPVGKSDWKVATTEEEAKEHDVEVGQRYIAGEVTRVRWLPLALGQRDVQSNVDVQPNGTVVEDQTISVRGRVKLGLDVAGGTELLYQLRGNPGEAVGKNVAETIRVLNERIDPSNVKEYRIQALKNDRILIQVPAATAGEVAALKSRLKTMGKLEFRIAVPRGPETEPKFRALYQQAESGQLPEGYMKMYPHGDETKPYYLVKTGEPAITGDYLATVGPGHDQMGVPDVQFNFNTIGSARFARITETNRDWALAVILDGVLNSAPTIQERIAGRGTITGQFTQQQVNDLVAVLRAGSLPMDIELLQESTVSPQLGRDAIHSGLLALAVAGILVLLFVGIYYIGCGWVADAALIINLVLLLGVLCLLGAALTLPGMAGVLLTVGMAVDANVLIFERVREEQTAGKGVRLALRNGYERAFTTIVDANVTTLLTGVILYMIGTGPVRGFAVTLCFGILLSMFTALTVTRLAFETFVDKGWMQQFRMFSFFSQPSIKFSSVRRLAYAGSLSVLLIGLAAFAWRGSQLYDIDFTGGTLVDLSLAESTTVDQVRQRLAGAGFERAEVQRIRAASPIQAGQTQFSVRVRGTGASDLQDVVRPEVLSKLQAAGLMQPGDKLTTAADLHGLLLTLAKPTDETAVRHALATGNDVYSLGRISTVEMVDAKKGTKHVTVHLADVPTMEDRNEVWTTALRALARADLATGDYSIKKCELNPDGTQVDLTLDRPLEWQVLATDLARREFGALQVRPAAQGAGQFVLTGPEEILKRFARELPAGSDLRGVPDAQIEGDTITAVLSKEFSEPDIRTFFDRQGFKDVYVVPLDLKATQFRLNISYSDVRQKLQSAFADLAPVAEEVTFEPAAEAAPSAGNVMVNMTLSRPMVLSTIRHYMESAGLGSLSEGIIMREGTYEPGKEIEHLTLALPADKAKEMQASIAASFGEPQPVQEIVTIGPAVAAELQGRALLAVMLASVIIVLYVAARFHAFRFGVAAVIALVHDILITAGMIALADWSGIFGDVKINLAMLAAFLTILGYSLNDTIVVFDRIRENMGLTGRKTVSADLIDQSVNQTLSRTVLTSLTTLMVVVVLYLMGGTVLQGLAFTLIIGIMVGTYSSVFVASPILLDWAELVSGAGVFFKVLFLPVRLPFKLLGMAFGHGRP